MRKVVFIATNEWVPWGGSELCWSAAAEKLARSGVHVSVSVKAWGQPVKQLENLRSLGCRIFYRPAPSFPRRLGRRLFLRRDYRWNHLRKIGANSDLIVISQGHNWDGLHWMETAKSCGFRYAVISQSAAEFWWPDDDLLARLSQCYDNAAAAYFVSEANLALSRRQSGAKLSSGRVIRNPFNVRYEARPKWPEGGKEELSLACVARLDTVQKGQDLLIEMMSFPHWRSRNVRVALVGSGKNECSLRRMVEIFNLNNISFAGFVSDIEELWTRHHALVLPSRFEGMPLALVEAMLCGRPCIVTDVAGHRELVRDGINGFLAKAPTVTMLDEALNRAWENRARLVEMGRTAALDVRKWVSPDPTEDFVRELSSLIPNS